MWTYTIALAPLLLLGALVWSGLRSPESAGRAALEASVGLVALLPLRQVLVPPDVQSLTRLDVVLSIELLAFIAWLAIAVVNLSRGKL